MYVEAAERDQAQRGEDSVEHVELFRMVSAKTPIHGDSDVHATTAARTPTTPPPTTKSQIASIALMMETQIKYAPAGLEILVYVLFTRTTGPVGVRIPPHLLSPDDIGNDEIGCHERP